ncbi:MAG: CHC2 zinc finger domain-containing protein [Oscillospiraceae bacterium]|nr:CHC2 zinc finger domain-containing protein [Oscillospiraceae bacterium]
MNYYGVQPNRSGFINCIFHSDKTPNMKLYDDHFHCFGCGKHGDIITLTEQLFSLSPYQATQKLSQDFNIAPGNDYKNMKPLKTKRQSYIEQENRTYKILNFYCSFLEKCHEDYIPNNPDDEFNPLFIESLMNYEQYNYYRDIFITGTEDERQEFMIDCAEKLEILEKRFTQKNTFTGGKTDEATTESA